MPTIPSRGKITTARRRESATICAALQPRMPLTYHDPLIFVALACWQVTLYSFVSMCLEEALKCRVAVEKTRCEEVRQDAWSKVFPEPKQSQVVGWRLVSLSAAVPDNRLSRRLIRFALGEPWHKETNLPGRWYHFDNASPQAHAYGTGNPCFGVHGFAVSIAL